MSTVRVAQKVLKLDARLASLRSGVALPKNIASLRFRYHGLAGESGGRHFIKESLGGLIFANPNVNITIDRTKKLKKQEAVDSKVESWKSQPGCFVSFNDGTEEAFFALTSARSEKLMKRFNDTMSSNAAIRALPRAKDADKVVVPTEKEVLAEGAEGAEEKVTVSEENNAELASESKAL